MRLLAIETATEACSLALFEEGVLLARRHEVLGRGHAERLVPFIAQFPDRGRADEIRVSLGPGSFTGVRIGLAAARALGLAWHARIRGFPTLALVAATVQARQPGALGICMSGGHGEFFVQNFAADGTPQSAVLSLPPERALTEMRHGKIAGNRAEALAALSDGMLVAIDMLPDAEHVPSLPHASLTDSLAPIYGRGPDARLPQ